MDALVLSCGTGGGHNSAAMAVQEELRKRGHNVVFMNPYSLKSHGLESKIDRSYISVAQRTPKLFGLIYKAGDLYRRLPVKSPVYYANGLMKNTMSEYLKDNHFDVVITSHLFPAEILTNMKANGMETPKTVFVATDYACTPFTEETDCDAYAIPSEKLMSDYTTRGINEEKLHPVGIPARAAFSNKLTREQARENLGLEKDKKYVLISGGSMGAGGMIKAIGILNKAFGEDKKFRMIVICGNNEQLYSRLTENFGDNLILIRHTDRMAEYMMACNAFITKPGGLSSTEAAVAGIPLIHISPIPGCECFNMDFFEENGMSIAVRSIRNELAGAVKKVMNNENHRAMQQAQAANSNASAASDICDIAEQVAGVNIR